MTDYVITVVSGLVGGTIGGIAAYWLVAWRRSVVLREVATVVDDLEDRVVSLEMTLKSAKGVQARQDKAAEWEDAMAEAMPILKGEGTWDEKMKQLAPLALKYPTVRGALMKQLGVNL